MTELRADARRNYDLLLVAAANAFGEHGTEASLRDVARRAGVGIGTLYRHFPTREALLEALLGNRFDRLRARAEALTAEPPREALLTWLGELAEGSTTYQGLPESVMAALHDETSQLHASCAEMRAAGGKLLTRAQSAGLVRTDISAGEALALAAGIAWASERSDDRQALVAKLLSVMMYGLANQPS